MICKKSTPLDKGAVAVYTKTIKRRKNGTKTCSTHRSIQPEIGNNDTAWFPEISKKMSVLAII
jgi:hypothetical protein